jgi:serine/threonine protein kinase
VKRAAGPFEILEILGEGSFGTVCVARVTGDPLRRKVALKILKGAYTRNKKILNRTRDEARLLSRISHPNIVRVERLMDVAGRPVIVMEHVQGISLDQILLRFKEGLPASIAIEMIRQTCLALHVAFNEALGDDGRPMRVIHRDIKPSNVLLSIHGEVKVVDFGIAKGEFEGREADTESVVMGSRPYMAPERLDGVADSPAVDVYSSGMSLFELLTGRTMSLSINPVTHEQAMQRQLGYLRVPGMPEKALEDLRTVIKRMCSYDRDYRPSAADVVRELEQTVYAIDPDHRLSLEEFARTTVLPIYESRPKIAPEESGTISEDEFLREVTGQLTGSVPKGTPSGNPILSWTPYLFVAALAGLVSLLAMLAGAKYIAGNQPLANASQEGAVAVTVWLPQSAQAHVGNIILPNSGTAQLSPGPTPLEVYFDDGRAYNCTFEAAENTVIRFVPDQGLSVNNAVAKPCNTLGSAPR